MNSGINIIGNVLMALINRANSLIKRETQISRFVIVNLLIMNNTILYSKLAHLPENMKLEVSNFIDFLI